MGDLVSTHLGCYLVKTKKKTLTKMNKIQQLYDWLRVDSISLRRRDSHLLLAGASTADHPLLPKEVQDSAQDAQQQQAQDDGHNDHAVGLHCTKTQAE